MPHNLLDARRPTVAVGMDDKRVSGLLVIGVSSDVHDGTTRGPLPHHLWHLPSDLTIAVAVVVHVVRRVEPATSGPPWEFAVPWEVVDRLEPDVRMAKDLRLVREGHYDNKSDRDYSEVSLIGVTQRKCRRTG